MPVYNVERYLDRCVESILKQTYTNFELILVDDGSPDNCPQICDEWAKKDRRVVVIHQENQGLSAARNAGIEVANGKFMTFIDSDDYVALDYLSCLCLLQEKYDADVVVGGCYIGEENDTLVQNSFNKEKIFSGTNATIELLYGHIRTSSCCILLRDRIAKDQKFPIGKFHEDELNTYRFFLMSQKVIVTNRNLYFYYQRPSSIMHSFGKQVLDEIEAADNYVKQFSKQSEALREAALCKRYSLFIEIVKNYPELQINYPDKYDYVIDILRKMKWKVIFNKRAGLRMKLKALSFL